MYKFHNNNALGLFENDCVIRSISTATNNSWDDTYKHLSNTARLQGTMIDDKDFVRNYLDDRYKRVPTDNGTVGEVAGAYPDNILLITMNGHITTSVYGVVFDSFDCRDRQAEFCWVVK